MGAFPKLHEYKYVGIQCQFEMSDVSKHKIDRFLSTFYINFNKILVLTTAKNQIQTILEKR